MKNKLFQVNSEFTSADLKMGTGTRVFLHKDGCTQLLNSKNTILARERRRLAIGAYNAEKAVSGIEKAKELQAEYLQKFEYRKRGLIIYTKSNDKFVPIYSIGTGPVAVNGAWFAKNQETVKRMTSENSVKSAQKDFKKFIKEYSNNGIMTKSTSKFRSHGEWLNDQMLEMQDVLTKQLVKVTTVNS